MAFNMKRKFNLVNPNRLENLKRELSSAVTIAEHNGKYICEYRPEDGENTYYAVYSPTDAQIRAVRYTIKDSEECVAPGYGTGEEDISGNVVMLGALLPEILKDEDAKDIWENHPERMAELVSSTFLRCSGRGKVNDIRVPAVIEPDEGSIAEDNGMIPKISMKELQTMFPNTVLHGTPFEVLTEASEESVETKELNGLYRLSDTENPKAFQIDWNTMELVEEAKKLACLAKASGRMRNFALRGNSGTGKSTAASQMAALLGVPYFVFSCSANLEETSMRGTFTPRVSEAKLGEIENEKATMPIFKSITKALKAIAERKNVTYELYKTALIEGLEGPGVLEIQEPNTVANPAVLNLLNSITDSCGKGQIQLDDGTIIKRHPDSIVIYTWNPGYAGTMDLSASILDRVNFSLDMKTPSAQVLSARSKKQFPTADASIVDLMAAVVRAAADIIEQEDITSGNASQRQLDSWVDAVFTCGLSIAEGFEGTVLAACSQDPEDRIKIQGIFDASPLAAKRKKRVNSRK